MDTRKTKKRKKPDLDFFLSLPSVVHKANYTPRQDRVRWTWTRRVEWDNDIFYEGMFNSVHEAVINIHEVKPNIREVYLLSIRLYDPKVSPAILVDQMLTIARERFGGRAEEWLEYTQENALNELAEDLNTLIRVWLRKHDLEPSFGEIEYIYGYDLFEGAVFLREERV